MNEVGFMKKATGVIAAAIAVLTVMPAPEVHAQTTNTIFPEGWDKSVRNRMFMRLGVISVNTKTKASDAVDLTGPVLTREDIELARSHAATLPNTDPLSHRNFDRVRPTSWNAVLSPLIGPVGDPSLSLQEFLPGGPGLGTPPGIKAKIGEASTLAISMGYWLTDDFSWMLEAFLLAKPLEVKAYGAGVTPEGAPLNIAGKHILTTKMLPPTAVLSRHFGSANNRFRPYIGIGATYAVLYDSKTTGFYDTYVGGKSTATLKNAFGVGPFVGLSSKLSENWHLNFQIGQVKLKTEAILTTRHTLITSASGVTSDFPRGLDGLPGAVEVGMGYDSQIVTKLMQLVLAARNAQPGATQQTDFGTFVRKQKQELESTIVNLSVGYSF